MGKRIFSNVFAKMQQCDGCRLRRRRLRETWDRVWGWLRSKLHSNW